MVAPWPPALSPSSVAFWNETPATFGPPSVGGPRQVVASDAGKWRASYEIEIHNPTRMLLARATIHGIMQGPLTPLLCGPFDCHHTPVALSNDPPGPEELYPYAWLTVAAALRDTTIDVEMFYGLVVQAGQYIGIANRLYIVAAVSPDAGSPPDPARYRWTIWPPLRADALLNAHIEMENPVCPMRIVGDVPRIMRDMLRFGHETIELEETI